MPTPQARRLKDFKPLTAAEQLVLDELNSLEDPRLRGDDGKTSE